MVKQSPSQQGGTCPLSEIRVTTVSNAAGTGPVTLTKQQAAKAWVNWNGESTAAIRDSFGVSGLTDNGTGDQTISFTSSFTNNDYSMVGMGGNNTTSMAAVMQPNNLSPAATGSCRHQTAYADTNLVDLEIISVAYLGDLA